MVSFMLHVFYNNNNKLNKLRLQRAFNLVSMTCEQRRQFMGWT